MMREKKRGERRGESDPSEGERDREAEKNGERGREKYIEYNSNAFADVYTCYLYVHMQTDRIPCKPHFYRIKEKGMETIYNTIEISFFMFIS